MNKPLNFYVLTILLFSVATVAQTVRDEKDLWQPYAITPRASTQHINLSSEWQLGWRDAQIRSVDELATQNKWINARVPATVQMALYYAGELPHPYDNLNAAGDRTENSSRTTVPRDAQRECERSAARIVTRNFRQQTFAQLHAASLEQPASGSAGQPQRCTHRQRAESRTAVCQYRIA